MYAMAKILEMRYELLPYSPDLTPSDFNPFPKVKIHLVGPRFFYNGRADNKSRGIFCRSGGI